MKVARSILVVLVLIAIAWGAWIYQTKHTVTPQQAEPTLTNGSSDNDLDKDMATIDTELTAIEEGSLEVDQSFTDQSTLK